MVAIAQTINTGVPVFLDFGGNIEPFESRHASTDRPSSPAVL